MQHSTIIAKAIDESPLNRGLRGADWVADQRNFAVVEGADMVIFDFDSDGVYDVHVFLKSRGRKAVQVIRQAFGVAFGRYGVRLLLGMVPDHRRDVKMMARWCGMKPFAKYSYGGDRVEAFGIAREEWVN